MLSGLFLLVFLLAACSPPGQPSTEPIVVIASPTPTLMVVIASPTAGTRGQATEAPATTSTPAASALPSATSTSSATAILVPTPTILPPPTSTPTAPPPASRIIGPENAGQVALLETLGQGALSGMVLLPGGQTIAAAYQDGFYLYGATTLDEIGFVPAEGFKASLVAHPDGRHLAVAGGGAVQIWDLETGQVFSRPEEGVGLVAFDAGGQRLVTQGSALQDGVWQPFIALWDMAAVLAGPVQDVRPLFRVEGISGGLSSLALSPDGAILASSGGQNYDDPADHALRFWDAATGQPLPLPGDLPQAPAYLHNLTFSPNGRLLVASDALNVYVWDVASGARQQVLASNQGSVSALAFDAGGQYLASGTVNGDVQVWSLADGVLVSVPPRHSREVLDLAFLPPSVAGDRQVLVTATARDGVQVLDLSHAEVIAAAAPPGPTDGVTALAYSPAGTLLAAASTDETIWLWNVATGQPLRRLTAPQLEGSPWCACYWSLAFSPDGTTLAAGGTDAAVRFWDVATGKLLDVWEAPTALVATLAYSPDGRFLVAGDHDGTLLIWDLTGGLTALPTLRLDNPPTVLSVSFTPDGETVATGSGFGLIRLWALPGGELLGQMGASNNAVRAVFSLDGRLLAAGSSGFEPDYAVRLWDPGSGAIVQTLAGHTTDVNALAFAPDGRLLASVDGDGVLRLWDVSGGQALQALEQEWAVDSVAFSPGGQALATGGFDGLVRIWGIP
jgi:WD40 repeat protein